MSHSIKIIEEFFGEQFAVFPPNSGCMLNHYDGCVHWSIFCDGNENLYWLRADPQVDGGAYPMIELAAFCSGVSTRLVPGVGSVLVLHPNNSVVPSSWISLTRTANGRISLSTSVGQDKGQLSDSEKPFHT